MQNSFNEYQERINRVLDFIDQNLGGKINIGILADVACFSPYHFHRIFHSIVGESVNTYVKRIRLSRAAQKLICCPNLSVTEIALECGFSSHSDFSRSFKAFYKMSPSQFAVSKERMAVYKAAGGDGCRRPLSERTFEEIHDRNISIRMLPDLNVAYIRLTGLSEELKKKEIDDAYSRLFRWAKARELINNNTQVAGITLDSPESVPIQSCRYDTCITLPEGLNPEGEIGIRMVNSNGKYAVYSFSRNIHGLGEAFFRAMDYMYGFWLPDNGYIPVDKPFIEFHYPGESGKVMTDFCIPIKPL